MVATIIGGSARLFLDEEDITGSALIGTLDDDDTAADGITADPGVTCTRPLAVDSFFFALETFAAKDDFVVSGTNGSFLILTVRVPAVDSRFTAVVNTTLV